MNDGHKEDRSRTDQGADVNSKPDGGAAQEGASASVSAMHESAPTLATVVHSTEPQTGDDTPQQTDTPCLAHNLAAHAPVAAADVDPPSEITDGVDEKVSLDGTDDGEVAVDAEIQLPAVVQGGTMTAYVPPEPYRRHAVFFLDVRDGLPPGYEFDEATGMISVWSAAFGLRRLCGPLRVSALTRTGAGTGWSREVQFLNLDGVLCTHVISASELIVNARGVVARLVDLGLDLVGDPGLLALLIRTAEVAERAETVHAPGWTGGSSPAFVMPTGEVVARETADATPRYQYQGPQSGESAAVGTLKGWQSELAVHAVGNPAMVFVIAYAFVGPLLSVLGVNTIGFHIYHRTSAGKSAVAAVAQSVWHSGKLQTWNVTAPALEQICLEANETFCVLDELPREPKIDLGDAIYLIFNGSNRAISAGKRKRDAQSWNIALLSTGEQSAKDILSNTGTARGGHLVRLIDVGLAPNNEELFQELHDFADSFAFVKHLEAQVTRQSGTAGRAFVEALVNERPLNREKIKTLHVRMCGLFRRNLGLAGESVQGEVARVVDRFAAVATAGEVATQLRILPWAGGDAYRAVLQYAARWLEDRGGNVSSEVGTIVALARDFLIRFGDSRFQSIDDARARRVVKDLAGWESEKHFHMTTAAFKLALAREMGVERAARCLLDAGYLTAGGERGSLQSKMPSGVRDHGLEEDAKDRPRCYSIKKTILAA